MIIKPGDTSRPSVEVTGTLKDTDLRKLKGDINSISIRSTATIVQEPSTEKPGWSQVTIRVDKAIDGDLLLSSLKDGLLHFWGWDEKFTLKA